MYFGAPSISTFNMFILFIFQKKNSEVLLPSSSRFYKRIESWREIRSLISGSESHQSIGQFLNKISRETSSLTVTDAPVTEIPYSLVNA